jgi:sec-independent protein translocase protein TatB
MGIGFLELVVIGVAALVLLGPKRLPEVMRQVARVYVRIRRTSNEFKSAFDHVVHEAEDELRLDDNPSKKKISVPSAPIARLESSSDLLATGEACESAQTVRPAKPLIWDDEPPPVQSSPSHRPPLT